MDSLKLMRSQCKIKVQLFIMKLVSQMQARMLKTVRSTCLEGCSTNKMSTLTFISLEHCINLICLFFRINGMTIRQIFSIYLAQNSDHSVRLIKSILNVFVARFAKADNHESYNLNSS